MPWFAFSVGFPIPNWWECKQEINYYVDNEKIQFYYERTDSGDIAVPNAEILSINGTTFHSNYSLFADQGA